jgi:purine-nucleoside phosphorylase
MENYFTLSQIDAIVDVIKSRITCTPKIAMILGSGLGSLAESINNPEIIPYGEIPDWPVSTVIGHEGKLVVGTLVGKEVVMMQGRVHYYEGYSMNQVTLPVRVLKRLGVSDLFVSNAAGAVNPDFEPGDLMMITDHLNLIGMTGPNPLRGPNIDELGPRFPDMSRAYDRELSSVARKVAKEIGLEIHEGVYICLAGPSFETPADLRFLRLIGVDAVGMSTVPEVTVAYHAGMRVLGISGITNKANLDGDTITTHEEVLEAGRIMVPKLEGLITGVIKKY